jgi:phosphatidylglycerol:prolipoprotein diacylglycerol transferase
MALAIPFPTWIKPEIIPGFPMLRWYGLMYLVAFAITYLLFRIQVRERGLQVDKDELANLFFWSIVGLIVGARLFAVTIYDAEGYYASHPLQIVWPFASVNGRPVFTGIQGMSYHGGLVGTVVGFIVYTRVRRIDTLEWGDIIVTGIPFGYFFGRLGNFINGELYGRVTSLPWGVVFPDAERIPTREAWVKQAAAAAGIDVAGKASVNLPRHPSQLYEALGEGILLGLVLWFVFRRRRPFKGFQLGVYLIGYGLIRFVIEYARQPDRGIDFPIKLVAVDNPGYRFVTPWNFTTGQILCFLMIVGGAVCLALFSRAARRAALPDGEPQAPQAPQASRRRLRRLLEK